MHINVLLAGRQCYKIVIRWGGQTSQTKKECYQSGNRFSSLKSAGPEEGQTDRQSHENADVVGWGVWVELFFLLASPTRHSVHVVWQMIQGLPGNAHPTSTTPPLVYSRALCLTHRGSFFFFFFLPCVRPSWGVWVPGTDCPQPVQQCCWLCG